MPFNSLLKLNFESFTKLAHWQSHNLKRICWSKWWITGEWSQSTKQLTHIPAAACVRLNQIQNQLIQKARSHDDSPFHPPVDNCALSTNWALMIDTNTPCVFCLLVIFQQTSSTELCNAGPLTYILKAKCSMITAQVMHFSLLMKFQHHRLIHLIWKSLLIQDIDLRRVEQINKRQDSWYTKARTIRFREKGHSMILHKACGWFVACFHLLFCRQSILNDTNTPARDGEST